MSDVVIIGAGHAGLAAATELHRLDDQLTITIVSNESWLPYHRPPLSKKTLFDAQPGMDLLQTELFYNTKEINLLRNQSVINIDRQHQLVELASGQNLTYSQLIIATGSCLQRITVQGGELAMGVYNYDDILALRPKLQAAKRVVVIGGGFIGCEVAAGALEMGKHVDLLITGPRALRKAVAPAMGELVTQLHKANGMKIHTGCHVNHVDNAGVDTNQGTFTTDLVIAGIGVKPNTKLAEAADLEVDNGIVVDQFGQTTDPNIYAAGDVASFPLAGRMQRLESIQNATDQSQVIAANICAHRHRTDIKVYSPTPWFWSDQGDLKIQMAGLSALSTEQKTLSTSHGNRMTALHLKSGLLTAVDTLNMPGNHIAARKLLAMPVDITWEMVQDSDEDLKQLYKRLR